jgi:hypothetical protein
MEWHSRTRAQQGCVQEMFLAYKTAVISSTFLFTGSLLRRCLLLQFLLCPNNPEPP